MKQKEKIDQLEKEVLDSKEASEQSSQLTTELRQLRQTVDKLKEDNRQLIKEKTSADSALAGFSEAHSDALAKAEKEKDQQIREATSDIKIEMQMLKDSMKKVTEERNELSSTVEENKIELERIKGENKEKEEALVNMEMNQKELEEELEKYNKSIELLKKEKEDTAKKWNELKEIHIELKEKHDDIHLKLTVANEQNKTFMNDISKHEEIVSNIQKTLDDKIVEHKINTKRSKGIIKDLKKSLLKESKLRNDMAMKSDRIKEKADAFDELQETVDTLKLELDEAKSKLSNNGGSGGGGGGSPNLPHRGSARSDDHGVTAALAGKMEKLLTENETVKVKISMLESIVQDLTKDLGDKRMLIKDLENRLSGFGTGGSGGSGVSSNNSKNRSPSPASNASGPPNFNLGSVQVSTPESRRRQSTLADAIDEI